MSPEQYLKELTQSIPVTSNLDVEVVSLNDTGVKLRAPLNTHINYEGTAFGGSLNTICILACYLSVHHLFRSNSIKFNSLVIQNSEMNYIKPVAENFTAHATVENIDFILNCFRRRGAARAKVRCSIELETNKGVELCSFTGRFVISS